MKKIVLLCVALLCVTIVNGQSPKLLEACKTIKSEWSKNFAGVKKLDVNTMKELDKIIEKKIASFGLSSLEREYLQFVSTCHKIEDIVRFTYLSDAYEPKAMEFIKNFTLDNKFFVGSPVNAPNVIPSYFKVKEIYNGTKENIVGIKQVSQGGLQREVDEVLQYKNIGMMRDNHILSMIGQCERYAGYCLWMDSPHLKNLTDEKVIKRLTDFKKRYSYLKVGGNAPDFSLMDSTKNMRSLSEFAGKVVVIDVWGTWCSGCIKEMPKFVELKSKYKNNDDVVFITIAMENGNLFDLWMKFVRQLNIGDMVCLMSTRFKEAPVGLQFIEDYNIMGAPRYFIIGRDGTFRSIYYPSPGDQEFTDTIEKSLAE